MKFKGRKCEEIEIEKYRTNQADLYNLYPKIVEMNGRRSNYSMVIINGEKREFGKCDVEIENKKVEQKANIRGKIARINLYMDFFYPSREIISKKNMKLVDT
jgi:deoxyribonuclease-1